jgi:hypothetical protein
MRLSGHRSFEEAEDFKKQYAMRAGIEAANSRLDRHTHIKHLRYRGMK